MFSLENLYHWLSWHGFKCTCGNLPFARADWAIVIIGTWHPCRNADCSIAYRYCWHDDVIKWKHFPHHWPFVRGIHRSPVNSPQKGQWRGALMYSLICVWINGWVNNREADDLGRYRAHYRVTVLELWRSTTLPAADSASSEQTLSFGNGHQWVSEKIRSMDHSLP